MRLNPSSVATIANAMDVGDPSNFARVLDLYGKSHEAISADISGCKYTDAQIAEVMLEVYKRTGYLLDPHGAIAYQALKEGLNEGETGFFIETAHPAKFKGTVDKILNSDIEIPQKLKNFMKGTKQSVELTKEFEGFKAFLLLNAK